MSTSGCAKAQEQAHCLLGLAISDLCLTIMDSLPAAPPPPIIEESEAQRMLWRLSELNFWFELLALHKHAGTAGCNPLECDQAIQEALQVTFLQAVSMDTAQDGLHSNNWQSHLPSLL